MSKDSARKTRIEHIFGTTASEVSELILEVDKGTGEISFGNAMDNVYSQASYERPKGPKVLSQVPQAGPNFTFDTSDALLKNYDVVCAVDTNTRVIRGHTVSVVAVATAQETPPPLGASRYWKLDLVFCGEFVGLKADKPENFGWVVAIEKLAHQKFISASLRIGMIVDSDLGNLQDYNRRKKPIFENRLLPSNVQLIYASADTGRESVVNQILKATDSAAKQVLDALSAGKVELNSSRAPSRWYDAMRVIRPQLKTYELRF